MTNFNLPYIYEILWFPEVAFLLFLAYWMFEINYFLRILLTYVWAKAGKKVDFLSPTIIYGIVLPTDLDYSLRGISSARLQRATDFAKVDHTLRTQVLEKAWFRGGKLLLGSVYTRYRQNVSLFSIYKIETKVVWWDDKNVYLTHKMITTKDNATRAVVYACLACRKIDIWKVIRDIQPGTKRPEFESLEQDYKNWMETLNVCSQLPRD